MRAMSLFMGCSEISEECPEKNIMSIMFDINLRSKPVKGFWIFDVCGIVGLGTKVNIEWVEEAVHWTGITKSFHFSID